MQSGENRMQIDMNKSFDNHKANELRNQVVAIDNVITQIQDSAEDVGFKALLVCERSRRLQRIQEILGVSFERDWQAELR
jgi:hypothetical protein